MEDKLIKNAIKAFIKIRDERAQLKKQYELDDEDLKAKMNKLEAFLLAQSIKTGLTQFKADGVGTAYRYPETSMSMADWDVFLNHVRHGDLWQLLEHRVSKKAAEEYRAEHNAFPPGINVTTIERIGIRRGDK